MPGTNIKRKVAFISSSDQMTGSIDKLVALSQPSGSVTTTSTLIRLESGDENAGGVVGVLAETMSFEPGTIIEGPFARLKVSGDEDNSEFLVYYREGGAHVTTIKR